MAPPPLISTRFLAIDVVLPPSGRAYRICARAAGKIGMDHDGMNARHHLTFDPHEEGELRLGEVELVTMTVARSHAIISKHSCLPSPELSRDD